MRIARLPINPFFMQTFASLKRLLNIFSTVVCVLSADAVAAEAADSEVFFCPAKADVVFNFEGKASVNYEPKAIICNADQCTAVDETELNTKQRAYLDAVEGGCRFLTNKEVLAIWPAQITPPDSVNR